MVLGSPPSPGPRAPLTTLGAGPHTTVPRQSPTGAKRLQSDGRRDGQTTAGRREVSSEPLAPPAKFPQDRPQPQRKEPGLNTGHHPGLRAPHAASGHWVQRKPGLCPAAGDGLCSTQSGRGGRNTHRPALASGSLRAAPRPGTPGAARHTAGLPTPGVRTDPQGGIQCRGL